MKVNRGFHFFLERSVSNFPFQCIPSLLWLIEACRLPHAQLAANGAPDFHSGPTPTLFLGDVTTSLYSNSSVMRSMMGWTPLARREVRYSNAKPLPAGNLLVSTLAGATSTMRANPGF